MKNGNATGLNGRGGLREGAALETALAAGHRARLDYYNERLRLLRGINLCKP